MKMFLCNVYSENTCVIHKTQSKYLLILRGGFLGFIFLSRLFYRVFFFHNQIPLDYEEQPFKVLLDVV